MGTQTISFKKLSSSGTMSASGLTKGCAYFVPKTGLIHIATSETKYDTFGPEIEIKETNGTELATIKMGDTTYSLKYNTSNLATKDDIAILDDFNADIADLYNTKQDASTAITTSNIGSQSVNYAASVPWTGVTNRPTNLSQFTDDVVAGKYLPLIGGTLTGGLTISSGNLIVSSGGGDTVTNKLYPNADNTYTLGQNGRRWSDIKTVLINGGTPIHSGNIGDQSVASAKVVSDHSNSRITSADIEVFGDSGVRKFIASSSMTNGKPPAEGSILHFSWDTTGGYEHQLFIANNKLLSSEQRMAWRAQDAGVWGDWKTIAFTDSNVASATKLATSRTIWGQSFDGTGNVSGAMTGVSDITMSGTINGFTLGCSVPSNAVFTDTSTNYDGHYTPSGSAKTGTASGSTLSFGGAVVTGLTYDGKGHVTGFSTSKLPSNPNTDTDTKNTAGSTNSTSKLFLVGAASQDTNPQTYSNSGCYTSGGHLYSNSKIVITDAAAAAGTNIGAVGTPSVTTSVNTSGKATFTFNYLKGEKGEKGDPGSNGTTPTIKAAEGTNINTVGTATVTAATSGTTTTFTFDYLKGEKGDKGDPGTNATTTATVSTSANGLAPKVTDTSGFLKGNGTWTKPVTSITPGTGLKNGTTDDAITSSGTLNLNPASTSEIGGIKVAKDNASYSVATNTSPTITANVTTAGKYYGVEIDKDDKAYVYVPWADTDTIPSGYCTTSATATAKVALFTNFKLTANRYFMINFANANSKGGALTLNVNNTGAKPIYINGTASSTSNYAIPAGPYIVFYNGTNYYINTDGTIPNIPTTEFLFTTLGDYALSSDLNDYALSADAKKVKCTSKTTTKAPLLACGAGASPTSGTAYEAYYDPKVFLNTLSGGLEADSIFAPSAFFQESYSASDERLKNFGEDIKVDFDKLAALKKKYFVWKDDENCKNQIGVSAQEIQEIYPELVSVNESTGYLSVSYDKLSVVALKAVDELYEKNKELEARLERLEKLISKE